MAHGFELMIDGASFPDSCKLLCSRLCLLNLAAYGWAGCNWNLKLKASCARGQKRISLNMAASKLQAFWNHPAGPKTIHFWAPTFKWGISIANVADFAKPPEMISYPQQVVVACSGVIWARWGMVITPINWNLSSVNAAMAVTGVCQLSRKIRHDYFSDENNATASLEG
uniref:Mitochondrial pyruvate carrier n=2 Tax=Oryza meridionalis TaxID=40149 RepID=A0A0E0ECZ2_9ORYZ